MVAEGIPLYEITCRKCGRVLGLEFSAAAEISLACPKCKTVNRLQMARPALLPRLFNWADVCVAFGRSQFVTY